MDLDRGKHSLYRRKVANRFWVLLLFISCSGLAQPKASPESEQVLITLRQQLQLARHDSTRIILIGKLATHYQQVGKADSGFIYLQKGIQLAQKLKQPLHLGRIYYQLGVYYDHQSLYGQSADAYQKGILFLQNANQVPEAARAMYTLARLYTGHGHSVEAVEQVTKNRAYANQTGFYKWVASAFGLLHEIHLQLDDEASAYADLKAILESARQTKDPTDLWLAHINLAEWHDRHHQSPKAQLHWQKAVRVGLTLDSPVMMAETYCGFANSLLNQQRLAEAERLLDKALRETQKDKRISIDHVQRVLARLREQQNRLPEAYGLSVKVLTYARKNYPASVMEILETLFRVQKKQGNYQQALETFQEIKTLSDSLREVKKVRAISMIESRLAIEKQQQDISLLKKNAAIQSLETERSRQQQTAYAGIATALVLILLLLGWFNWQVRQNLHKLNQQKNEITTQAQRLQELNTLKDKLFALIGHDLRGPVMNLKSNLNQLLTRRLPHHQFAQQADRLNRTVDALYTTLDNLLHWSALQLKGLIIQPQSVDLSALVMETMELLEPLALQKNITVAIEPRQLMAWTDESQTQIVIRNILQNALKFTPPGGRIEVSFNSSATESVIRIADTGIGMAITDPQQAARTLPRRGTLDETGTGLGLLVCDEFMKRNGGRLQIDSEVGKGTRVTLFFLHASPLNHVLTSSDLHLHETDGFGSR